MYNYSQTPPPYGGGNGNSYNAPTTAIQTASSVMKKVYLLMTFGLLTTAVLAFFCASSPSIMMFMMTNSWCFWGLLILEFVLLFSISGGINRMSGGTAQLLFFLFSAVNGVALAPIFIAYSLGSIAKTFFICSGTFGAMSIYGYCTSQDLTKWGKYLFFALIGLIIASIVNIFTKSSSFEWIISFLGVLIFVGITAWDTQNIKRMAQYAPATAVSRLAAIGALSLYLDFINLFLYLLRIFGSSRD